MSVETIEAYVENGQIRLPPDTHLPERAKVYIVVPEAAPEKIFDVPPPKKISKIISPRLANREQVADFKMKFKAGPT